MLFSHCVGSVTSSILEANQLIFCAGAKVHWSRKILRENSTRTILKINNVCRVVDL